LRQAEEQKKKE